MTVLESWKEPLVQMSEIWFSFLGFLADSTLYFGNVQASI